MRELRAVVFALRSRVNLANNDLVREYFTYLPSTVDFTYVV